ncbi:hypothetical protein LEP1GSC103_3132 [Leptospira borgpetersenii serovar Javanica str. UI 09931]|uniref:Uncharacterized protein n=4 Tax=Leptospira borgpetersenii TaxID=174 RepID=M3GL77_LEPBO|nr:hypothetical protein LEP1GSC128_2947 [Leptospira borgpetersenii str. 200801926]EKQ91888.1 hypothetical protein LEP1GSC101_3470 [Leptospira borgpetersenii str. UI 09149]EMG01752.1 hypothetical protein LEP1GSC123_4259 [Leptospira borgpetersenii str. 200701203]EMK12057.1 hypothetical protein LEP1GSC066_2270 [Leptospira sp. serovar Kenya str. Sh9]EMN14012.1 hypothetical protein LEP1GSC055_2591 [Leptospira borgpetersenii str. Brem 307]EMN18956.1 hypothetical protein LEP1GSC056_2083 [Leptospira b
MEVVKNRTVKDGNNPETVDPLLSFIAAFIIVWKRVYIKNMKS